MRRKAADADRRVRRRRIHRRGLAGPQRQGNCRPGARVFLLRPRRQRLYLWLPGGENPAGHVIEAKVRSTGISTCDLDNYDIAGFKVTHASAGIGGSFGSNNTMENMEVTYADFCGIGVGGSFNTLVHCRSNYNGNTGISTFNRGHRIVHCEVRFNNRRRWIAGWHAGGMKNFSSDTVVSGVAEGNVESPGIWFDGSNTGVSKCQERGPVFFALSLYWDFPSNG